jgi:hypothetical protein
MVLLIENSKMNSILLRDAVKKTFQRRKTHETPSDLEDPPKSWASQFTRLTAECGIASDLEKALDKVRKFCIIHSIFAL